MTKEFMGRKIDIDDKLVNDFKRIMHEEVTENLISLYISPYLVERKLSDIPDSELNDIVITKMKKDLKMTGEYEI